MLQKALEAEGYGRPLQDVIDKVKADHAQLWVGKGCVLVTELHVRPDGKACHVWLAAPENLEGLRAMADSVIQWAKSQGCVDVTADGREGWLRVFRDLGLERRSVVMGVRL